MREGDRAALNDGSVGGIRSAARPPSAPSPQEHIYTGSSLKWMRLPPRLPSFPLSHTLSISSLPILVYISLLVTKSPHHLLRSSLFLPSLHHFKLPCFHCLSPFLFSCYSFLLYLPCRCLVSLVPFKARQMDRQVLSPSSGPNDLFLTMGPNGPQIINDEGSMER